MESKVFSYKIHNLQTKKLLKNCFSELKLEIKKGFLKTKTIITDKH